jgi:hypothetical protein
MFVGRGGMDRPAGEATQGGEGKEVELNRAPPLILAEVPPLLDDSVPDLCAFSSHPCALRHRASYSGVGEGVRAHRQLCSSSPSLFVAVSSDLGPSGAVQIRAGDEGRRRSVWCDGCTLRVWVVLGW